MTLDEGKEIPQWFFDGVWTIVIVLILFSIWWRTNKKD